MTNPTAAILVIGDEILSGRTKDKNIGWLAEELTKLGISLCEARVIGDEKDVIMAHVNICRMLMITCLHQGELVRPMMTSQLSQSQQPSTCL
ncbi:MAG: hypothetical protein CM15mP80_03060 [Alphaproteobacteria bacterium]|nr:MAG: hypothetical protein CM15mP80_03060 [Alphaproteobacteria bacterium]